MAKVQDWRVGAVKPGLVDAEQFPIGMLRHTGRDGGGEERRGRVVWVGRCHDAVRDFEISHVRSQGADDPA